MNEKPTALVMGGGVAGLAAAVCLDELGYTVRLIEKKPLFGGRTFSFQDKKTGLTIDNGQHLMMGAYHETLLLLEKVGAKSKVFYQTPSVVPFFIDGVLKELKIPLKSAPWGLLQALLSSPIFTVCEKFSFLKLGRALQKLKNGFADFQDCTARSWLEANHQSESAIRNFWNPLVLATLNDSVDVASAKNLIAVLLKAFLEKPLDAMLVFPKQGLSEVLVDPAIQYLEQRGHSVESKLGVKAFRILNHRVQSVTLTNEESIQADLYVSALPLQVFRQVLPEPFLQSRSDLNDLRKVSFSPITSINLVYRGVEMPEAFVGTTDLKTHWFFNKKKYTQDQKLSDDLIHIMGVVSGSYDDLEKSKSEILEQAKSDLIKIYPQFQQAEFVHGLVNIERQATPSFTPETNELRVEQKILENFYAVGDWTQTNLPATIESASRSAALMAKDLRLRLASAA